MEILNGDSIALSPAEACARGVAPSVAAPSVAPARVLEKVRRSIHDLQAACVPCELHSGSGKKSLRLK